MKFTCVAQITGFPARLHFAIIIFCATNTFCGGISIPISPRATIIPSASSSIASKLMKQNILFIKINK